MDRTTVSFPDRMEVLCTLLSVAGPQLDWARPVLADCWRRVEDMCSAEDTVPRIRFLLQVRPAGRANPRLICSQPAPSPAFGCRGKFSSGADYTGGGTAHLGAPEPDHVGVREVPGSSGYRGFYLRHKFGEKNSGF